MLKALKIVQPVIFALIGAFLLFVSFKDIEWGNFVEAAKDIPLKWVFISIFLGYLAYVFRALRWALLIYPIKKDIRTINLIHSIAFGYLWNSVIPRSGELIRCTSLSTASNIPVSVLLGHVILERLIDLIILLGCVALSIILNYNQINLLVTSGTSALDYEPLHLNYIDWVISHPGIIICLVFILMGCMLYRYRKLILSSVILSKIDNFISGVKSGFISIKNLDNKTMFIVYTSLIWVCYFLMTVICFRCFQETLDLTIGQGLFVFVAGGLGMVIPTPSGIGSYHFLVKKALVILGVGAKIGLYFAVVVHGAQTIMVLVAGFIGMSSLYYKRNE
jgi:uncharacterized protein (TIRG00374 family)